MKKIFLITALLIYSVIFSQVDTFVNKYNYFVTKINGVNSEPRETDVTAVFNENNKTTIVIHINGNIERYFQISTVTESETDNGSKFQIIRTVREKDGVEVVIQLFERNLRLLFDADYIEFFY